MKNRIVWTWSLGLALSLLPLAGGCTRAASYPLAETSADLASSEPGAGGVATNADEPMVEAEAADLTPAADPATPPEAPAPKVPTEKALAPSIRTIGAAGDLFQMAKAGVGESVLLAYVTNSTSIFNLNADEIIYLNTLGVPASVASAALDHDRTMKAAQSASIALAQPPPPGPPEESASAQMAPQFATTGEGVEPLQAPPPPVEVGETTFDDTLAPYGTWVNVNGYGRCWQPAVLGANPDWQPYSDAGHWIYTDCGWYWMSDYSWGWAPFHYGRWFRDPRLGWCWKPDTTWGPCWVSWRYDIDYCGWAPLAPDPVPVPVDCFFFVAWGHFPDHHLHQFGLGHDQVNHIFHHTHAPPPGSTPQHREMPACPAPSFVSAATHREIRPVTIQNATVATLRTGRGETLTSDGQSLHVFRLGNGQPSGAQASIRGTPQNPTPTSIRLGQASTTSPGQPTIGIGQPSTSPGPSFGFGTQQATEGVASRPTRPENYPHGSIVVIGNHDRPHPQWQPLYPASSGTGSAQEQARVSEPEPNSAPATTPNQNPQKPVQHSVGQQQAISQGGITHRQPTAAAARTWGDSGGNSRSESSSHQSSQNSLPVRSQRVEAPPPVREAAQRESTPAPAPPPQQSRPASTQPSQPSQPAQTGFGSSRGR
jgi:hypothetical protein